LPGAFWSQEQVFLEAANKVISVCQQHSLPLGILCGNAEQVRQRHADGFNFLGMGTDVLYLLDTFGKEYASLHNTPEPPEGWANRVQLT
jgi:2-keto-3-deoxy-L-rhamnonate aldolase RhmA